MNSEPMWDDLLDGSRRGIAVSAELAMFIEARIEAFPIEVLRSPPGPAGAPSPSSAPYPVLRMERDDRHSTGRADDPMEHRPRV